ncbi:MAG: hypothetical protein M3Y13_14080 [Armatimonadota bacterium]|nr:hypothetical protein [Armatimonadota bacterium]
MTMTIGDVLAFLAVVFLVGATWVATILMAALAFPRKAGRAQEIVLAAPGASLARGVGLFSVISLLGAVMMQSHAGPIRLVAGLLWSSLAALSVLGSAGIARLLGERIQSAGTHMTPFATLTRGTILYVLAGFLPIIGWFLILPVALFLSLGSAVSALRTKADRPLAPNSGGIRGEGSPLPAPQNWGGGAS